jgi:hypothetical protein
VTNKNQNKAAINYNTSFRPNISNISADYFKGIFFIFNFIHYLGFVYGRLDEILNANKQSVIDYLEENKNKQRMKMYHMNHVKMMQDLSNLNYSNYPNYLQNSNLLNYQTNAFYSEAQAQQNPSYGQEQYYDDLSNYQNTNPFPNESLFSNQMKQQQQPQQQQQKVVQKQLQDQQQFGNQNKIAGTGDMIEEKKDSYPNQPYQTYQNQYYNVQDQWDTSEIYQNTNTQPPPSTNIQSFQNQDPIQPIQMIPNVHNYQNFNYNNPNYYNQNLDSLNSLNSYNSLNSNNPLNSFNNNYNEFIPTFEYQGENKAIQESAFHKFGRMHGNAFSFDHYCTNQQLVLNNKNTAPDTGNVQHGFVPRKRSQNKTFQNKPADKFHFANYGGYPNQPAKNFEPNPPTYAQNNLTQQMKHQNQYYQNQQYGDYSQYNDAYYAQNYPQMVEDEKQLRQQSSYEIKDEVEDTEQNQEEVIPFPPFAPGSFVPNSSKNYSKQNIVIILSLEHYLGKKNI